MSGPVRLPLTPQQYQVWVATAMRPNDPFFSIPFAIHIRGGSFDQGRLAAALADMVRAHGSLRSTVVDDGGSVQQLIHPSDDVSSTWILDTVPSESVSVSGADELLQTTLQELARGVVDLETGPLLRTRLIELDPDHHVLAVAVHHIVFDGWSLDLFVTELADRYAGVITDTVERDVQELQARAHATPPDEHAATDWWSEILRGASPSPNWPTSSYRRVASLHRGRPCDVTLDEVLTAALRACARSHRVSMAALLCAAVELTLEQYTEDDIVIGTPLMQRGSVDAARAMGYLVSPVLLRGGHHPETTVAEVLRRVQDDILAAVEHPEVPLDRVLKNLGVSHDPAIASPYPVMMSVQCGYPTPAVGGLEWSVSEQDPETMKVEVSLALTDEGATVRLAAQFDEALFEVVDVQRFATRFTVVCERIATDSGQAVAQLRTADPHREEASSTSAASQHDLRDLITLDDDPSPIFDDGQRTWTRQDLSNQVAEIQGLLQQHGVRPGDAVGVCLPPSFHGMASIIAVLGLGAVCVPMPLALERFEVRNIQLETGFLVALVDSHTHAITDGFPAIRVDCPTQQSALASASWAPATDGPILLLRSPDDPERNLVRVTSQLMASITHDVWRGIGSPSKPRVLHHVDSGWMEGLIQALICVMSHGCAALEPASYDLLISDIDRLPARASITERVALVTHSSKSSLGAARAVAHECKPMQWLHIAGPLEAGWFGVSSCPDTDAAGTPREGVTVEVWLPGKRPAPPGCRGEIVFGGAIAPGYADLPSGAPRFDRAHDGSLRVMSGWRGRLDHRGRVELLGDLDVASEPAKSQIATTRIEQAIQQLPGCDAARVWATDQGVVGAYIGTASAATLLERIQTTMSRAFHPDRLILVDSPRLLTESTPPGATHILQDASQHAPARGHDGMIEAVRAVWCDVLGRTDVSTTENFFDAGGTSVLLIRLRNELASNLGLDISLTDLFRHPTVHAIAQAGVEPHHRGAQAGAERGQNRRTSARRNGHSRAETERHP